MQVLRVGLVSVLCAACFNPSGAGSSTGSGETTQAATGEVPTTTDGPTGGTGSGTAAATTEPGGTSGGSTGEGSTSGGETVEPAVCGNGKVEMGEVCDDGNMIEDDGCLADCTTLCGDGDLDEGEACDDGDRIDGDGCSATCRRDAAYVFVTRDAVPAMLGGIGGADTVCHDAAVAGGLPGTYRAWLGEGGTPVAEHVAAQSLAYVRPDGALVAVDFASFVTDAPGEVLAAPIAVTEYGEAIAAEEAPEEILLRARHAFSSEERAMLLGWLSRRMKAAKIVDPAEQQDRNRVLFGATVTLADEDDARRTITIVGDDEADAGQGRVGWNSPIARAVGGAALGDLRKVSLPAGEVEYEIMEISYPNPE